MTPATTGGIMSRVTNLKRKNNMKKYNAKARVKATGEILEEVNLYIYDSSLAREFDLGDLEIIGAIPDYWTRLEHQTAIAAMQGMLNNSVLITGLLKVNKSHEDIVAEVIGAATRYAHALVEKMKEERK